VRIRIVAPSSVVPKAELALGVAELKARGFQVSVDPRVGRKSLFFAGSHAERGESLIEAAYSDDVDVIWCARGGYGSNHLLSSLAAAVHERGKPQKRKLLVGSSDATSLMEFARTQLGFWILHSPMPGLKSFGLLPPEQKESVLSAVRGAPARRSFKLKWWGAKPAQAIRGRLVGGNLTVWNTLLGTRLQPRFDEPSILFLEDVTETLPRLDRAFRHLADAGGFEGVRALVLGNFLSCEDAVPMVIGKLPSRYTPAQLKNPPKTWLAPLRKKFSQAQGLKQILEPLAAELGIPLAYGLPVGHGPEQFALPLGAEAEVSVAEGLKISSWDWSGQAQAR